MSELVDSRYLTGSWSNQRLACRVAAWDGLFGLTALFLIFEVLSAPLRFALFPTGFVAIVYLPKALLLLAFVLVPLVRGRVSLAYLVVCIATLFYLVLGIIHLPSTAQALFGVWVIAPLLFGCLVGPLLMRNPQRLYRLCATLFWLAWIGVVLELAVDYPWIGALFHLAGADIETSRKWTTFGLPRFAGFASSSITAANQLLLMGIFLTCLSPAGWKRWLLWLAAGGGIFLTTSKGPLGAWILVTLYFVAYRYGFRRIRNFVVVAFATIVVVVPLSTLFFTYSLHLQSFSEKLLFTSFGDRLTQMWPDSLGLLKGGTQWIFGRGLGGIGSPQHYFEPARQLAGDNLFVYVCVDCGVIAAIVFVGWLTYVALDRRRLAERYQVLISSLLLAIIATGLTLASWEGPVTDLFLGFALTGAAALKRCNVVATSARSLYSLMKLRTGKTDASA